MAAVKITNEDDYISPSQSCINPLFTSDRKVGGESGVTGTEPKVTATDTEEKSVADRKRKAVRRRRIPLELKLEQNPVEIENNSSTYGLSISDETTEPPSAKATLSVADCLACSGCITSAEAVLVTTKHSIDTLKEECLEDNGKTVVFTISPAVIADITRSLTKYWDYTQHGPLTSHILYHRLANFLKSAFHAKIIMDGSLPQRISLLESGIEFCHRYRALNMSKKDEEAKQTMQQCAPSIDTRISLETPSISLSATQTRYLVRKNLDPKAELEGIEIEHDGGVDGRLTFLHSSTVVNPSHVLPMLSSSCPGFICYVEKTVPEIIPNLCTSKSPMAIAGSIFKHQLLDKIQAQEQFDIPSHVVQQTKQISESIDSIYHVAIMPCYDKALEANRKDLAWSKYQQQQEILTPDVDLVITSNQLLSILAGIESESSDENREQLACKALMIQSIDVNSASMLSCNHEMELSQSEVRGSGSYAEFMFRFASHVLFGYKINAGMKLPWKSSNMSVC
jgi:iron only hydrogenase large subunit-like protein